jgi:outer membrane protein insertion porin family
MGYGAGLSIETGIGVLGVSYALGQGDAFSDGKIHFGILNEF